MGYIRNFTVIGLDFLSTLFVFVIGLAVLAAIVLYFIDRHQSESAVRHNFPVIGRFRDIFIRLGEFFRQYFFAMDREEQPFNRAQRDWVYASSQGASNVHPFGSTLNLSTPGVPVFASAAFARLDDRADLAPKIVFGEGGPNPYATRRLINISGMSYGAISRPAVQALSRGARRAGCWLTTGEGGLAPYHLEGGCDVVFQIGTAKYGVRNPDGSLSEDKLAEIAAHDEVKMIEVKLSQGAKPGKGGILPGGKVTAEIARIRGIPEGEDSISPNRFYEISTPAELLDFIARVRGVAQKPVGFKSAWGSFDWLDELCAEIRRRGKDSAPDFITVDGGEGGTGASLMPLIDNVGLSIRIALPSVVDRLAGYGLRERVRVIASGKLITPAEVAWAYCAGADSVNSARGFMFSIGCIQAMRCHTNTCPTGVTTHLKHLQAGLDPEDKQEHVQRYVEKIEAGVSAIAHACGVDHARALTRGHVRIVQPDGCTPFLSELYPGPDPDKPAAASAAQ